MPTMRLAALLLLALLCAACTKSRVVQLYNNTPVDLVIHLDGKVIDIAPGTSAEVTLRGTQWIDFGMIAHRYEFGLVNPGSPTYAPPEEQLLVQVENDGRLYIVPAGSAFPVTPLPEQPSGFPVSPAEKVDLT